MKALVISALESRKKEISALTDVAAASYKATKDKKAFLRQKEFFSLKMAYAKVIRDLSHPMT